MMGHSNTDGLQSQLHGGIMANAGAEHPGKGQEVLVNEPFTIPAIPLPAPALANRID
jgi:hypothetical protein